MGFDVIVLDDFLFGVEAFDHFPKAIGTQEDAGADEVVAFAEGIGADNHGSLNNFDR